MSAVLTRFAPSPTGLLHVGNARTALVNYLYSAKLRRQGADAKFMLRIDDTDLERSRPEYTAAIENDLKWLGLQWDMEVKQSDRLELYEEAKRRLIEMGRLYPAYETPEELDTKRKMQLKRGVPPVYDRAALKLSDEQKRKYESEGRRPHYRFLLEDGEISWNDGIREHISFHSRNLTDPILYREDKSPTYIISSVVDDGELKVSDVIRGEDHISNTAIQIQIFQALGFAPPRFSHLSLLKTKDGEISKRLGGFDIAALRESGVEPVAVLSLLARIGTSAPTEPKHSLDALVEEFDMGRFGRAAANYDPADLERLNARLIGTMSFAEAEKRLAELGISGVDAKFWDSVRHNISTLKEVEIWRRIALSELEPVMEDRDFCAQALNLLPGGDWDESTFGQWMEAVKKNTGRKGRDLFMPIRKILTAREDGPELKNLLPLIGPTRAIARLKGEKS